MAEQGNHILLIGRVTPMPSELLGKLKGNGTRGRHKLRLGVMDQFRA